MDTLSYSFISAALLVVVLSGNRKNKHVIAHESVDYKVLSKNLKLSHKNSRSLLYSMTVSL